MEVNTLLAMAYVVAGVTMIVSTAMLLATALYLRNLEGEAFRRSPQDRGMPLDLYHRRIHGFLWRLTAGVLVLMVGASVSMGLFMGAVFRSGGVS